MDPVRIWDPVVQYRKHITPRHSNPAPPGEDSLEIDPIPNLTCLSIALAVTASEARKNIKQRCLSPTLLIF